MITIDAQFDCTQRELVADMAGIIYQIYGFGGDPMNLFSPQNPRDEAVLSAAEAIFALLTGDRPDYDDEPEVY
jgi:hypothetical protein